MSLEGLYINKELWYVELVKFEMLNKVNFED